MYSYIHSGDERVRCHGPRTQGRRDRAGELLRAGGQSGLHSEFPAREKHTSDRNEHLLYAFEK